MPDADLSDLVRVWQAMTPWQRLVLVWRCWGLAHWRGPLEFYRQFFKGPLPALVIFFLGK